MKAAVAAHLFVSACGAFMILCVPGYGKTPQWHLTPVSCTTAALRWLFWLLVFAAKASASWSGVLALSRGFRSTVLPNDQSAESFFRIWHRIIEYMQYEDKLMENSANQLSFLAVQRQTWTALQGRLPPQGEPVRTPLIFTGEATLGNRVAVRQLGIYAARHHWPQNADVEWRLLALARGLGLGLQRPFRVPCIPGLTVLIPHYGEAILTTRRELHDEQHEMVPLISWVENRYKEDFTAFLSKGCVRGTDWRAYGPEAWDKVEGWASMRSQVLWRTAAGMTLYHQALDCHFQAQGIRDCRMGALWDASEVLTCMVSMQMYPYFTATQFEHTTRMLRKLEKSLKIAYIDFEEKEQGEGADRDRVHPKQARRYFGCLIDKDCDLVNGQDDGSRVPRLRLELPGYPILGDGKGDNQNHALPFTRGMFVQAIDANQGAYFEQMLMLPNVLGKFRSGPTKTVNLSKDIFAGMDFTLRGLGRTIRFREYFHHSKGRDMGLGTVLMFFSKLSACTGEQFLARQVADLRELLALPEALTFCYAHAGFYLTQFFVSKGIPVLVSVWLLILLNDTESNFEAFDAKLHVEHESAPSIMAALLCSQFRVMVFFLVAGTATLLVETTLQNGPIVALIRCSRQLLTEYYVLNEIVNGRAAYVATGRGLPTERRSFITEVTEVAASAAMEVTEVAASATAVLRPSWALRRR